MKHIDKEIFHQEQVSKRLRPLSIWYWVCAVIGVVCTLLYFTLNNASSGLSNLLMGLFVVGDLSLLIIVCYYLFGDSRGAYSKECHSFLNREFNYYPRQSRQSLVAALDSKDAAVLAKCKRGTLPELVVVRYYDANETVAYCQILEMQGGNEVPISEVVKFSK